MRPLQELGSNFAAKGHRILLGSLALTLLLNPFVESRHNLKWILTIMLLLVLLAAVRTVATRKRQYHLAVGLGLLAAVPQLGLLMDLPAWLESVRLFAMPVFLFWVCALLLQDIVVRSHTVTAELILGAINVYLMVGIAFAFVFGLIGHLQPASFSGLAETGPGMVLPYLYFSFVTLTTLGYGDITPLTSVGMTAAYVEAMFGQLYLAVLVARLVGLYITRQTADR